MKNLLHKHHWQLTTICQSFLKFKLTKKKFTRKKILEKYDYFDKINIHESKFTKKIDSK